MCLTFNLSLFKNFLSKHANNFQFSNFSFFRKITPKIPKNIKKFIITFVYENSLKITKLFAVNLMKKFHITSKLYFLSTKKLKMVFFSLETSLTIRNNVFECPHVSINLLLITLSIADGHIFYLNKKNEIL